MRRALFVSALLLVLACSLSWGASAADLKSFDGAQGASFSKPMPSPVPMASCTETCWFNPSISCTSPSGNCRHQDLKGVEIIRCDGVIHVCNPA
ncbi:MAG: hypothetical protein ABUT39_16230 [Acidobacteriota bacterium]